MKAILDRGDGFVKIIEVPDTSGLPHNPSPPRRVDMALTPQIDMSSSSYASTAQISMLRFELREINSMGGEYVAIYKLRN